MQFLRIKICMKKTQCESSLRMKNFSSWCTLGYGSMVTHGFLKFMVAISMFPYGQINRQLKLLFTCNFDPYMSTVSRSNAAILL